MPNTTQTPLLQMRAVRKRFGATQALDGVDLSVDSGEVLALVGENGAGKSTLMKVLSGAHSLDSGEVLLGGKPFRPRNPLEARRAGVTMIYQEMSLAPHLSVVENILLGIESTRGVFIDLKAERARAAQALAQVGHAQIPLNRLVSQLSVAEQQLVEIARALVVGSRVLVLDEPTSSLARGDIEKLFALVSRLKDAGQAIIYISHFLEEVREVSGRYVVLRDGRSVGEGVTARANESEIIRMMVGRTVDDLYPRSERRAGEVVLDIQNLGGNGRLRSASLQLRRGEVVGVAGLIGAGRTELLRAIFGLDRVAAGQVRIAQLTRSAGQPTAEKSGNAKRGRGKSATPAARWAQAVGMVSEDRKTEGLALALSITDNLTLTRLPIFIRPSIMDREAEHCSDRVGVRRSSVRQLVGNLSGGNQQKVALARLLHHDADILLLDEPTRGIDVASKAEIYRVIDDLAARGKAVLVVSSYLPELIGICDRIAVMCRGVLGPTRPVSQLDEHKIMLEATGIEQEGETAA